MEGLELETSQSRNQSTSKAYFHEAPTITDDSRLKPSSEIQRKAKKPPPVPEKPKCLPPETINRKVSVERNKTTGNGKNESTNVLSCGSLEEASSDSSSENEMFVDDLEQLKAEVEAASTPSEDQIQDNRIMNEAENLPAGIAISRSSDTSHLTAASDEDNFKSREVIDNEPTSDYTQVLDSIICDDQIHKVVVNRPSLTTDTSQELESEVIILLYVFNVCAAC
ncbi:uncharacterized protein LOC106477126, partial [Limulus polyphemus]|uniref:Uncharacterized protein LOC106477126 n=1 Tax=Limulus polyphemus TaxID=6850 RepID=A0ABM1RYQ8_LIMPO